MIIFVNIKSRLLQPSPYSSRCKCDIALHLSIKWGNVESGFLLHFKKAYFRNRLFQFNEESATICKNNKNSQYIHIIKIDKVN